MIYSSDEMEMKAALDAAERICAAARTAPKARGFDYLHTLVLTGEDKDALADEMDRLADPLNYGFMHRDANCVREAQALVLFGMKEGQRGLNDGCGYCHFKNCADCAAHNGVCVYDPVDVGIALGSAAAAAADARVDSRILFSVGRAAIEKQTMGEGVTLVFGLPLSVTGKSPFFDRKGSRQGPNDRR